MRKRCLTVVGRSEDVVINDEHGGVILDLDKGTYTERAVEETANGLLGGEDEVVGVESGRRQRNSFICMESAEVNGGGSSDDDDDDDGSRGRSGGVYKPPKRQAPICKERRHVYYYADFECGTGG